MDNWEKQWSYKIDVTDATGHNEIFLNGGATLTFQPGALVTLTVPKEPKELEELKQAIRDRDDELRKLRSTLARINEILGHGDEEE